MIANRVPLLSLLACTLLSCSSGVAEESSGDPDAFTREAELAASASEGAAGIGIEGAAAGWWFLRNELEHLAQGRFWERDFAESTVTGTNPVPVIVQYHEELEALGVRLILCPVPPKASIYPEKFSGEVAMNGDRPAEGAVHTLAPFLQTLTEAGVEVLDLEATFNELRAGSEDQLYCAQDSHWSPVTCRHVARLLAELCRDEPSVAAAKAAFSAEILRTQGETLHFHGDLLTEEEKGAEAKEELPVSHVGTGSAESPEPLATDPESPVLVVGDSHTLVFNEGASLGMHDVGAGLVDHLAAELGFPVDREASKGSGGDSARANVARRSKSEVDLWEKKKVVLWVFSAREFTRGKWRPIPANVD